MGKSTLARRDFCIALAGGLSGACQRVRARERSQTTPLPGRRWNLAVQTRRLHQVIDNFGASGCWSADPIGSTWSEAKKNELADLLFSQEKGIGLSLWRFNIGAGSKKTDQAKAWHPWRAVECFKDGPDAPYDWSRHAGQQWFLRAAKQRGTEQFLAFANSPPIWLTRNGHAYSDTSDHSSTNLKPGSEDAYAHFLAEIMAHFQEIGLPFTCLSPINEPNWAWEGGQEGCRYSNSDIQRLLMATHRALRERGVKIELDAADGGDLQLMLDDADYRNFQRISQPGKYCQTGHAPETCRQWVKALLGDPSLRTILGQRISCHSYWTTESYHALQNLRQAVRQNIDRYAPGARYWQTEFCFMEHHRDLGIDTALRLAEVVHYDLTAAGASAWHWWLALSDADYKDGLIYVDTKTETIQPSKMLWALGNYSRFIRPGAHRVSLATDALPDDLLASAYIDKARQKVIVVLINANETAQPITLAFDQATGPLTPYITDATRSLTPDRPVTSGTYEVPARSIVTLVGTLGGVGGSTLTPKRLSVPSARRARASTVLYDVRCGMPGKTAAPGCNSRWDMPYGTDPGTGFAWGYSSYGTTSSRSDLPAPNSGVRWEDGNTPGQGILYRFSVPEGKLFRVEVVLQDPWKMPQRKMDIEINGEHCTLGLIPGDRVLVSSFPRVKALHGEVVIRIVRSADSDGKDDDPMVSAVKIELISSSNT